MCQRETKSALDQSCLVDLLRKRRVAVAVRELLQIVLSKDIVDRQIGFTTDTNSTPFRLGVIATLTSHLTVDATNGTSRTTRIQQVPVRVCEGSIRGELGATHPPRAGASVILVTNHIVSSRPATLGRAMSRVCFTSDAICPTSNARITIDFFAAIGISLTIRIINTLGPAQDFARILPVRTRRWIRVVRIDAIAPLEIHIHRWTPQCDAPTPGIRVCVLA